MIRLLSFLLLALFLTTAPLRAEVTEFATLLAASEQAVESGQLRAAGGLYKRAIAFATGTEGEDSSNAIIGRMGYVTLLIDLNKLDDAVVGQSELLSPVKHVAESRPDFSVVGPNRQRQCRDGGYGTGRLNAAQASTMSGESWQRTRLSACCISTQGN